MIVTSFVFRRYLYVVTDEGLLLRLNHHGSIFFKDWSFELVVGLA